MESIEFTCSERDFLAAQRLHHTLAVAGRRFLIRISIGAVAVGLFITLLARGDLSGRVEQGLLVAALYVCLMAVLVLTNRLIFMPRAARRQFKQRKEFGGSIKYNVHSPNIEISSKNGFSNTSTEDFLKWAENSKTVLIYRSDNMFHFIPLRPGSEAFHAKLMAEFARANLPKSTFSRR